jgi:DinB superfamily
MTVSTWTSLAPRQAAALLGTMPIFLRAEFEAAPEALLRWRPASEEWCLLEVVGHLIETEERGFAGRIRTILTEERPQFTTWDPSAVARERQDERRDPAELLAEFIKRRTAGVALVETLTATDLDRGGDHPEVGFLIVNDLLHEWIHHDANHLRQMLANIQSYTWPSMGNAQRFSAPDSSPNGPG